MIRILGSSLLALSLVACASAGKRVDRTHIKDIMVGVQDKAQIRSWFGSPYTMKPVSGHPKGCVERWTYEFAKAQGFGTVTYSEILIVDFSSAGKVCDHAFAQHGKG